MQRTAPSTASTPSAKNRRCETPAASAAAWCCRRGCGHRRTGRARRRQGGRYRHPAAKLRNPHRPAAVVFEPGFDRPAVLAVATAALAGGRLPFLVLVMLLGVSATERTVFAVLRLRPFGRGGHQPYCDQHDKCKANEQDADHGHDGHETRWRADGCGAPPVGHRVAASAVSVHRLEDRHDLLRPVDRPRIGEGPVVEHAVRGDALQVVALDADVAQPPRQAEPRDEAVEHLGRRLAGRAERGADLRLAIGIDRRR